VIESLPADARPTGVLALALGVLTKPRMTYRSIAAAADPSSPPRVRRASIGRAAGVLALAVVASAAPLAAFSASSAGRVALLDQEMRVLESFGVHPSSAEYARMQQWNGRAPAAVAVGFAVGLPLAVLLVAAALALAFGRTGSARFSQALAVTALSTTIVGVRQLIVTPLDIARGSLSNPVSLATFVPAVEEGSFPAQLLGGIDPFVIWWIVSLAIGAGVLYRRRARSVALTFLALYAGVAIAFAAVKSAAGA